MKAYKIGVIIIDIELKDRSRIKEFFLKTHNRFENFMFFIISKIPERLIPRPMMEWLEHYLDKRIRKLKQQTIKQEWKKMELQNAVDEISKRQQNHKQ